MNLKKIFTQVSSPLNFLKALSGKGFLSKAQSLLAGAAVISAATLALPQEAKGATAYALSQLSFSAFFDLNGEDLDIFTPGAESFYKFGTDNPGNDPQPDSDFFDSARNNLGFNPGFGFVNVEESIIDPSGYNYFGVSELYLGPPENEADSNDRQVTSSASFTATGGDVFSMGYSLVFDAFAEIEGFDPGDTKSAFAGLTLGVGLFSSEDDSLITELLLEDAFALIAQENGSVQDTDTLGGIIDFTVEEDGEYFISIGVEQSADANVLQQVPEPTSVIGFLSIGALGLGLKRKKQNEDKA